MNKYSFGQFFLVRFVGIIFCTSLVSCIYHLPDKQVYLQCNHSKLDISDNEDYSSFAILDVNLNNYQVYFTGETHGEKGNHELEWKMLKYLYKKHSVRVFVVEESYSGCYMLDYYLQKRDSLKFEEVLATVSSEGEEHNLYRKIYMFNKDKTDKNRIIIRGVDAEFCFCNVKRALKELLPKNFGSKGSENNFKTLIAAETNDSAIATANSIINELSQKNNYYKEHFLNNYPVIYEILKGTACENCKPYDQNWETETMRNREALMYTHYLSILKEFPNSKFYGQFGDLHISRELNSTRGEYKNWISLAAFLDNDNLSPIKNKVCSINLIYFNDTQYSKMLLNHNHDLFHQLSQAPCTLFDLNGKQTPFDTLTHSIQYLIMVNYPNNNI